MGKITGIVEWMVANFKAEHHIDIRKDCAAVLSNTLEGNVPVLSNAQQSLILLDVIPMSLSIETVGGVETSLIEVTFDIDANGIWKAPVSKLYKAG